MKKERKTKPIPQEDRGTFSDLADAIINAPEPACIREKRERGKAFADLCERDPMKALECIKERLDLAGYDGFSVDSKTIVPCLDAVSEMAAILASYFRKD